MEPTYEELKELNLQLSIQIVGMTDRLQQSAKEIAAKAWDEGKEAAGFGFQNPYRRETVFGL